MRKMLWLLPGVLVALFLLVGSDVRHVDAAPVIDVTPQLWPECRSATGAARCELFPGELEQVALVAVKTQDVSTGLIFFRVFGFDADNHLVYVLDSLDRDMSGLYLQLGEDLRFGVPDNKRAAGMAGDNGPPVGNGPRGSELTTAQIKDAKRVARPINVALNRAI